MPRVLINFAFVLRPRTQLCLELVPRVWVCANKLRTCMSVRVILSQNLATKYNTIEPLKITDPKGNDIPIEDFIAHYEPSITGLKLESFLKVPRCFCKPKSVDFTTLGGSKPGHNEKITITDNQNEEGLQNHPNSAE
jgi:hypothetical protein